jgi:hypothetical protein
LIPTLLFDSGGALASKRLHPLRGSGAIGINVN